MIANRKYRAYGRIIESDLPLPFVESTGAGAEPGIRINRKDFAVPSLEKDGPLRYAVTKGHWVFSWEEANYRLAPSSIDVHLNSGVSPQVSHRLAGALVGLSLRRRGSLVLHGNVVARPDGCLALLGTSGSGKTTLTRRLLSQGWSFLSDDLCVLDMEPNGWVAHPGPGRLKVRVDGSLIKREDEVRPEVRSWPLKAVIVLEPVGPVSLSRISGAIANLQLVTHAHMPRSLEVTGAAADHFRLAGCLAASVPLYHLSRGTSRAEIPEALAEIGSLMGG